MSKSLGNGIDPFDMIDKYGCDTLRYFLTTNSAPGLDLRFSEEKMSSSWNYINKIWNISRFINMNIDNTEKEYGEFSLDNIDFDKCSEIDYWIINRFNQMLKGVDKNYDNFEFGEAAKLIYNFTWDDFASWYLELTKVVFANGTKEEKINTCKILVKILINILKLLHPFMPFVTEEIYQNFNEGSIMVSDWPIKIDSDLTKGTNVNSLIDIITSVRNIRHEKNVALSKKIPLKLETNNESLITFCNEYQAYLDRFVNFSSLEIDTNIDKTDAVVSVLNDVNVIIPLKELMNVEEELIKARKEETRLLSEIERCNKMLSNPNFTSKAPASKIEAEQTKLNNYKIQLDEVKNLLKSLEKLN